MRKLLIMAAATAAFLAVASAAGSAAIPYPQCPPSILACPGSGQ